MEINYNSCLSSQIGGGGHQIGGKNRRKNCFETFKWLVLILMGLFVLYQII